MVKVSKRANHLKASPGKKVRADTTIRPRKIARRKLFVWKKALQIITIVKRKIESPLNPFPADGFPRKDEP